MIISNNTDRDAVIAKISNIDLTKQAWKIDCSPFKANRNLAQNALYYKWLAELGKQSGNGKEHERNYCKFTYGCGILLSNEKNTHFIEFYESLIDRYEYEELLGSMEFINITSDMTVKEMAYYLQEIELYAGEQGYRLTHPEDLYYDALGVKI